jgi:protein gp37
VSTATSIEWTETTWNPTTGCDRISPGCDHCYALTLAKRLKAMGQAKYQTDGDPRTSGPGFGVALHPRVLLEPLGWRKARHVFVDSMADLLHAKVPVGYLAQVWAVMALTPQHTYQVLTKRPERYRHVLDGQGKRREAGSHESPGGLGTCQGHLGCDDSPPSSFGRHSSRRRFRSGDSRIGDDR